MRTFTFYFNQHQDSLSVWDEWNMRGKELDVTYDKDRYGIHIVSAVYRGVDISDILRAFDGLTYIVSAAEENYAAKFSPFIR